MADQFQVRKLTRTPPGPYQEALVGAINSTDTVNLTNVAITSNVLTVTASNTFVAGMTVTFSSVATATFLDTQTVTVSTASSIQFTAAFTHSNYSSTPDTGIVTYSLPGKVTLTSTTGKIDPNLLPSGSSGTVTSVSLAVPAEFSVSGSPITSSGTITIAKVNENANTVWAGPTSGGAATPAFRALVSADIPSLSYVTSVALSLPSIITVSGSPVTSSGTLTGTLANQSANTIFSGPTSGGAAGPTFRSLVGADLPNPSSSTLGGIRSLAAVSHQWINTISTSGIPSATQPQFSDISGTITAPQLPSRTGSISYIIDGGGGTPTTGTHGQLNIPVACTVTGWVITADASGSAVVDILRSTYAGFPSTSSIVNTDPPTLSSAQKNENLVVSAWTSTSLLAGDQLQFSLTSVTTCTRLNITLIVSIPWA